MRLRRRVAIGVAVVALVWVLGGVLRAGPAARDWFVGQQGGSAHVRNVTVDGVLPAVPPFWNVSISGDVVQPGNTSPSYRSYMVVWIEPFTGWVFLLASG